MDYNKELHLLHLMQQVYSSLISVSNKLQTTGDKYCVPLTSRQYMTVLAMLHLPEEETTIVNIAYKLGATMQNVTQLIKSLEKKVKELETLWNLLIKLYRFDGAEMDGFEDNVEVPNMLSDEEVRLALERFSLRRRNQPLS